MPFTVPVDTVGLLAAEALGTPSSAKASTPAHTNAPNRAERTSVGPEVRTTEAGRITRPPTTRAMKNSHFPWHPIASIGALNRKYGGARERDCPSADSAAGRLDM